jgi:PIN domain nuclease of toxin-antitoxin system
MPKADERNGVLLDTHALLWWIGRNDHLSAAALRSIESASRVYVSPMSLWEVAMLVEKTRLDLHRPTRAWVGDVLAIERVHVAELTPAVAVDAAELADFHGDPADRIIVCTATARALPLVTKDSKIRQFARKHRALTVVW